MENCLVLSFDVSVVGGLATPGVVLRLAARASARHLLEMQSPRLHPSAVKSESAVQQDPQGLVGVYSCLRGPPECAQN